MKMVSKKEIEVTLCKESRTIKMLSLLKAFLGIDENHLANLVKVNYGDNNTKVLNRILSLCK
jgi:hypothetical protein